MSKVKKKTRANTPAALPDDVSALGGWRRARNTADVARARPPTRRITINLDADVVAIFKAEALRGGAPYQVAINQALRTFLRARESSDQERAVELVLKALDDETVREKLRQIH